MAIHKIQSGGKEHVLNFNSYAVMQACKKYGLEGLAQANLYDLYFDMLRWGLSDNGRNPMAEAEVYDFIDGLEGGANGELFIKQIAAWVTEAFLVPEVKKKEEAHP